MTEVERFLDNHLVATKGAPRSGNYQPLRDFLHLKVPRWRVRLATSDPSWLKAASVLSLQLRGTGH